MEHTSKDSYCYYLIVKYPCFFTYADEPPYYKINSDKNQSKPFGYEIEKDFIEKVAKKKNLTNKLVYIICKLLFYIEKYPFLWEIDEM